mmetsp:Transcript_68853/g.165268  ORF Transcript_68853/g.165268 Transcript_68853/m.165268 type:complete len:524 (-) Transcript_68853:69-1640(-)
MGSSFRWSMKSPMERLGGSYRLLLWTQSTSLDLTSKEGKSACSSLLAEIAAVADELKVPQASRQYRRGFTRNYVSIFGGPQDRRYNLDVFKAAVEWSTSIYVNGQSYNFSQGVAEAARNFVTQWKEVQGHLHRQCYSASRTPMCTAMFSRNDLKKMLEHFDILWVQFEEVYIKDLMEIESRSRQDVVEAQQLDARLKALEAAHHESGCTSALLRVPEYFQATEGLLKLLGKINSVANHKGKGRDDLGIEILVASMNELISSEAEYSDRAFAETLADDTRDSWEAVRKFFAKAKIELVDPQLSNNSRLVEALVDWEDCWAKAAKYLLDAALCNEMCELVNDLQDVQTEVPRLQQLILECDTELFFVLPRLVLFHFLLNPEARKGVVQKLLPQFFQKQETPVQGTVSLVDLYSGFARVRTMVEQEQAEGRSRQDGVLWQRIVEAVVVRGSTDSSRQSVTSKDVTTALEDFILYMEPWSIQLQRQNPEDWNQCCQAIVDTLRTDEDEYEDETVQEVAKAANLPLTV